MAIPESQLEIWSHQGSITQSSTTYNSVKNVLEDNGVPYSGKDYEVFLQGSYGNSTNTYAESDVDLIIMLNDCFQHDLDDLPEDQRSSFKLAFADASYDHMDFKRDVLSVLESAYRDRVIEGNKAIKIDANASMRKVDVVVAIQFRRYTKFCSSSDQHYIEGICFYSKAGQRIVNYPKQHSKNCTSKHQLCQSRFKPMVRVIKNIRNRLVSDGSIASDLAPSYFLEGLFYNVPENFFKNSYGETFTESINWILEADKSKFLCANEQYYLLRDGASECWQEHKCNQFVAAAVELWNQW